jgi:membrane protein implicated in regulation of membrane protease activity
LLPRARHNDRKRIPQGHAELADTDHLGEMPRALAALLLGTAYLAAIVAFSGVIYLRGLALVYADIIQYPILLGAMAVLGCLLVPLSRAVFRRLSRPISQSSGSREVRDRRRRAYLSGRSTE